MAVATVHAPAERRHAGGFGQRQAGSFEAGATLKPPDRPRNWPERVMERNASSEPPQARIGDRARPWPSDCARQREFERSSGLRRTLAGRSESRMPARAPVTNLWQGRPQGAGSRRLDIGRQARPAKAGSTEGSPDVSQAERPSRTGRPHAGESGVGSNAGPICIAPCPRSPALLCKPFPESQRAEALRPRGAGSALHRKSRATERRVEPSRRRAVAAI